MILFDYSNKKYVSENIKVADNYFKRLKGLMFSKSLPEDQGLLIIPCSGIHSFFMKYSIDVLYLDKCNKIIFIDENFKPWKIGKLHRDAYSVIELPEGIIKTKGIKIGHSVSLL